MSPSTSKTSISCFICATVVFVTCLVVGVIGAGIATRPLQFAFFTTTKHPVIGQPSTLQPLDSVQDNQPINLPLGTNSSGKPKIWLYHDGATGNVSELATAATRLSVKTVYAQNSADFDVHIVGKTSIHRFLNRYQVPSYFDKLPTNIQGDLGSIALLAEHGGVYLDTDVVVFRSLLPLYMQTVTAGGPELVSMRDTKAAWPSFVHGFMGARPGSPLLAQMFSTCLDFIKMRGNCTNVGCNRPYTKETFGWAEMIYGAGNKVLKEYMAQHGDTSYKVVGRNEQYTPQPWGSAASHLFESNRNIDIPGDAFLVHWMHHMIEMQYPKAMRLNEAQLMDTKCMFSILVHKALGI